MAEVFLNLKPLLDENGPVAVELLQRVERGHRVADACVAVDTGRLKGSLRFGIARDALGIFGFISADTDYAVPQEFGTWKMPAHPFLRPGLSAATGGL